VCVVETNRAMTRLEAKLNVGMNSHAVQLLEIASQTNLLVIPSQALLGFIDHSLETFGVLAQS